MHIGIPGPRVITLKVVKDQCAVGGGQELKLSTGHPVAKVQAARLARAL